MAAALARTLDELLAHTYTKEDAAHVLLELEDEEEAGEGPHDARALAQEIKKIPTLVVYIPGPLSQVHIERIAKWCRKEIADRLFLEIKVDGRMTGGCAFAWQGVLYNFSLDYFLHAHEEAYAALLNRVLGKA